MQTDPHLPAATRPTGDPAAPAVLRDPIEFCPAAACAAAIVRLEGFVAHVGRLHAEAGLARSSDLMRELESISEELMLAADEARERLARVEAVSAAGAIAQLLCAIRDIRVSDDHERERARDLEAKAIRFLANASLYDAPFSNALSQTRLGRRLHTSAGATLRQAAFAGGRKDLGVGPGN